MAAEPRRVRHCAGTDGTGPGTVGGSPQLSPALDSATQIADAHMPDDSSLVPALLRDIDNNIDRFTADGAYDIWSLRESLAEKGSRRGDSAREGGCVVRWGDGCDWGARGVAGRWSRIGSCR